MAVTSAHLNLIDQFCVDSVVLGTVPTPTSLGISVHASTSPDTALGATDNEVQRTKKRTKTEFIKVDFLSYTNRWDPKTELHDL